MNSPVRRDRSQAGTTLIEVLIAVTLLSLLSVAMAFALRIGLNAYQKTNSKLMENRRVAGAQRILEEELEGIVPAVTPCGQVPPTEQPNANWFAFFQATATQMRLVSTFSLQQAWRGSPLILELFVIPRDDGPGVRLVVNELPYYGPLAAGRLCTNMAPDPVSGQRAPQFLPVSAGTQSFVLADKLAYCRFNYLWQPAKFNPENPVVWSPTPLNTSWPLAVRVEMAPLEPDAGTLQPLTVTAALHLHLLPTIPYVD
jgi:type II secretory pathway pseudopilin PulG